MNDFASSLFDEELPSEQIEQVVFDYRLLSAEKREFVIQKTDETQILLKRTAEKIIEIGKNLLEVKKILPYGMFLPWLRSEFGMSQQTANNFMNVAERFDNRLLTVSNLSASVLYMLASPSTSQEAIDEVLERTNSGEKVTKSLAKQIIDAQDAIKKAQEAEAEARAQALVTQQQLFKAQSEANTQIDHLNGQIKALRIEMDNLQQPETVEVTKEVLPEETTRELARLRQEIKNLTSNLDTEKKTIPPATQAKLADLQKQIGQLNLERSQQEERIKKLNADIDTAIQKREFAENADRIRQKWRLITSEVHSALMRLLGQWPTPIDTMSFESNDWGEVEHLRKTLQRVLEECNNLHYGSEIVDSGNRTDLIHFVDAG